MICINTNINIDEHVYESFKVLSQKAGMKKGYYIGQLITAEVEKHSQKTIGKQS